MDKKKPGKFPSRITFNYKQSYPGWNNSYISSVYQNQKEDNDHFSDEAVEKLLNIADGDMRKLDEWITEQIKQIDEEIKAELEQVNEGDLLVEDAKKLFDKLFEK